MRSTAPIVVEELKPKADISHLIAISSHIALIVFFALWFFVIAPPATASAMVIFSVHALPLALFLPALIKRHPRTYAWLCFFVLFYFCQGTINTFLLPSLPGILGLIETILTTVLFLSAMMCTRWYGQIANASR